MQQICGLQLIIKCNQHGLFFLNAKINLAILHLCGVTAHPTLRYPSTSPRAPRIVIIRKCSVLPFFLKSPEFHSYILGIKNMIKCEITWKSDKWVLNSIIWINRASESNKAQDINLWTSFEIKQYYGFSNDSGNKLENEFIYHLIILAWHSPYFSSLMINIHLQLLLHSSKI